ncbi:MAG: hypothetical protein ACUZ8H_04160 [Candidatus Anammoxibacter sp.]
MAKENDRETDLWLSVRDYLNELSDVACRFDRKEIGGNEFQGKIKGLLKDSRLKAIPERVRLLEGYANESDNITEMFPVINLALCAVDVARQRKIISKTDNLSIHPSCNMVNGKGNEFLLECASDALTMIVERFDTNFQFYSRMNKSG